MDKHHTQGKEDFTRVLEIDYKNEKANYFGGIAAIALGEYKEGITDLTASLKQKNDRGIAHLLGGLAYGELGLESDAVLDINSESSNDILGVSWWYDTAWSLLYIY